MSEDFMKKCFNRVFKLTFLAASVFCGSIGLQAYTRPDFQSVLDNEVLQNIIDTQIITSIDQLPSHLPKEVKANFVLKHGVKREGERGHLIEKKVSQSSDPHLPRAILWDEQNGYSLSYNGGGDDQTAKNRLDILSFDVKNKKFQLQAVNFQLTEDEIRNGQTAGKIFSESSCTECHGPHSRPIFSMYPDWPAFYGSDNDELNNSKIVVQQLENKDYQAFLMNEGHTNQRYAPLFDTNLPHELFGLDIWSTYPYRQDTSTLAQDISRSFAFRPGLRVGILYNRLNAQNIFSMIKSHKNYDQYKGLVLHSLLQCDWSPSFPKTRDTIKKAVNIKYKRPEHLQINYNEIFKLFDLKLNDVDIRYSYNHQGYLNEDASENIMQTGYIGKYFNSYFDGTATIDELLIASFVKDLILTYGNVFGDVKYRGLEDKYRHLAKRFTYDQNIFKGFDQKGLWFPIPYPKAVFAPHHRETFTPEMKENYDKLCVKTTEYLKRQFIK
jgi:hypothetical protein